MQIPALYAYAVPELLHDFAFLNFQMFLDPARHIKVDSRFAGGRLVGVQEVELELEHVADFLTVSRTFFLFS